VKVEMMRLLKSAMRVFSDVLRIAACAITVAMLVSFASRPAHRYDEHFRSPVVRRIVERETSIAAPKVQPADDAARLEAEPTASVRDLLAIPTTPAVTTEVTVPPVAITRWLRRLKLGKTRAGAADPLA